MKFGVQQLSLRKEALRDQLEMDKEDETCSQRAADE
jgi:hypothetical protein